MNYQLTIDSGREAITVFSSLSITDLTRNQRITPNPYIVCLNSYVAKKNELATI